MTPSFSQLLLGAASTLTHDVAPQMNRAPNAQAQLGTIGLILACAAQEADRAVETAVLEQDALRALFAEAAHAPLPDALRTKLNGAGRDNSRPSLKLSALEAETAKLNALLMELLERVEGEHFDWAIALETRIWGVLKAAAERRALYLPVL